MSKFQVVQGNKINDVTYMVIFGNVLPSGAPCNGYEIIHTGLQYVDAVKLVEKYNKA